MSFAIWDRVPSQPVTYCRTQGLSYLVSVCLQRVKQTAWAYLLPDSNKCKSQRNTAMVSGKDKSTKQAEQEKSTKQAEEKQQGKKQAEQKEQGKKQAEQNEQGTTPSSPVRSGIGAAWILALAFLILSVAISALMFRIPPNTNATVDIAGYTFSWTSHICDQLEEEIAAASEEKTRILTQLMDRGNTVFQLADELEKERRKLKELTKTVEEKKSEVNTLRIKVADSERDERILQQKLKKEGANVERHESIIKGLEKQLKDNELEYSELQYNFNSVTSASDQLAKELSTTKTELDKTNVAIEEERSRCQAINEGHKRLQDLLDSEQQQSAEFKDRLLACTEESTEAGVKASKIEELYRRQESLASELQQELAVQKEQNVNLNNQLELSKESLLSDAAELKRLNKELVAAQEELGKARADSEKGKKKQGK